ncbi:acyltransferase family protein [Anaeromicropila herbilytica]|uniref:Acyltransferase n=1 Tax=Anaeromicropila herbilytica TaxID=2785025 RepID=A0A7R7IF83_9FIRM|nr:acyltransferase family protein [Anaeromicropila herbilytica]BCN32914.1 acyltransferase [Anaeromicropila herbilytica]
MEFNAPVEKKRIAKWDNLKALLIFTIVIGHMADYYTDNSVDMRRVFLFIYTFHMPAFLFISGLFSKKNIDEKRYSNIFSYLILYYVIKILIFVTRRMINGEGDWSLLEEDGSPWYAFALFAYCFMTIFMKKLEKKYAMMIAIIAGCLVNYDSSIRDFLVLARILVFYPFFLAGYYMNPKKIVEKLDKNYIKIVGFISFIALAFIVIVKVELLYDLRPLLTGRNPYSEMEIFTQFDAMLRLGYYALVFVLVFLIIALVPKRKLLITKWGKNSISIYAIHRCIIYILFDGLGGMVLFKKIYPEHPDWLIIPTALLITILLSPDFIAKGLHYVIKPKLVEDVEKN